MLLQLLQQLFGSAKPDQLAEEDRPGPLLRCDSHQRFYQVR